MELICFLFIFPANYITVSYVVNMISRFGVLFTCKLATDVDLLVKSSSSSRAKHALLHTSKKSPTNLKTRSSNSLKIFKRLVRRKRISHAVAINLRSNLEICKIVTRTAISV